LIAEERGRVGSPGPGSYAIDIQQKLRQLNSQFAARYKANPFGSNKERFLRSESLSPREEKKPAMTAQDARELDLRMQIDRHVQSF
jgi:hypothetical protein